tara:strand:- start:259 stop:438 length:180 start_codon:yes stop_codon:yes gene_type:complete
MEAKYKVGDTVSIIRDNEIITTIVFGYASREDRPLYSLKTEEGEFLLIEESDIIARSNE